MTQSRPAVPEPRNPVEARQPASKAGDPPIIDSTLRTVPGWAVIGIFLLLLVAGIAYARVFLMPVVLAFILALIFSPVRRFLVRRGVPSGLSATVVVAALFALLTVGVVVLAEPAQSLIENAPQIGRELEVKLRGIFGSADSIIEAGKQLSNITSSRQSDDVQEVVLSDPGVVSVFAYQAPSVLAQVVFILVLLLFLLASGDMFYEKLVHVMPTFKDKRRALNIAYDIERKLSRYLFTITIINAGLGIAVGTAMWLLGMPSPALFGVIAFVFNYAPYLGGLVALSITATVSLVTFDDVSYALVPAIVYFGLNAFEGQIVTPFFVGRKLEMNTVVIFLSVAFWAWLWSIMGMLVAVPLLVIIRAFCEHVPKLQPLGDFLSMRGGEIKDDAE